MAKRKKASYSRIFYVCTFGWYALLLPTYLLFSTVIPFYFPFSPSLFSFLFLLHLIIIMRERAPSSTQEGFFMNNGFSSTYTYKNKTFLSLPSCERVLCGCECHAVGGRKKES